jgi:predicted phosphodiesterase
VAVDGVLFCHGSPRSDTEIITALTPEERLAPMFEGVAEDVIVCGHTHHQFDRAVLGRRLLNAGSVGMPYEDEAAAYWLLLDPEPRLRRTDYDVPAAVERLRASGCPDVDEVMLRESLLAQSAAQFVARHFEERATR